MSGVHATDGVIVVDKPAGVTSHDVVAVVRRTLGERRVGHTGTLDPLATGVLALACGRATRLVRFFAASDKEYEATIRFGLTTDTFDVTGTETSRSDARPDREAVVRALSSLTGSYLQMPPAFSAKKVGGRRAYKMARADEPVTLSPAPVTVARADLLQLSDGRARVSLACSAGFYVRTFAHEMGARTGTGACLDALRRTRSGEFTLAQAVTLDRIARDPAAARAAIITLDRLLLDLPSVRVAASERERVAHGQEIGGAANAAADWVRVVDEAGRLLAMARSGSRPGLLHPAVVLI